jgi:hypothetical protein
VYDCFVLFFKVVNTEEKKIWNDIVWMVKRIENKIGNICLEIYIYIYIYIKVGKVQLKKVEEARRKELKTKLIQTFIH